MKSTTFMAIIAILFATSSFAQKPGYTIAGHIKDLPDGTGFYLILNKDSGGADTVSHVKSKNGEFVLTGILEDEGQLVFVKMDTSVVKVAEGEQTWVRLMLDNSGEIIKLTGKLKEWPKAKIDGSKLIKEHDNYYEASNSFVKELDDDINAKIQNAKDQDKITALRKEYSERYVKNLNSLAFGSYVVPLILYSNGNLVQETKEVAYQGLSDKQKNSYYGKLLAKQIASLKASKNIGIGKLIPDFQIKSSDGKVESIRNLATKSKYTLVDFWASWCIPCRQDIPNMRRVYDAFKSNGFNILSISTDSSLASWQKALREENTPWINCIQQGNVNKEVFGLISIPAYILLNEKAEIVKMDLNSKFFGPEAVITIGGAPAYVIDSKKKRLRGDDLYEVIEGLLGEGKK